MRNLALHWQILIGMIAGCCIGLALNMAASERSVKVKSGLPAGIVEAEVNDSSSRTVIRYRDDSQEITVTVDPASRSSDGIQTYKQLAQQDSLASQIYNLHGKSVAKQVGGWCQRIGGLFLRMLQMVSVPLIITSLLSGILSLSGRQGVGKMFKRTLSYYLTTSLLAILTGLLLVNLIRPGLQTTNNTTAELPSIEETHQTSLIDVMFAQIEAAIPSNPIAAITQPNFLSIIAFTIIFGVFAVRVGGTTATRIQDLTNAGLEVMMAITTAIIRLAPLGVFFLMTAVLATQGSSVFRSLGWYVLTVTAALLIHACITLPLILKIIAKRQPLDYARAMSPALLTAFSSASSNGTLPVTLTSVEQRAVLEGLNEVPELRVVQVHRALLGQQGECGLQFRQSFLLDVGPDGFYELLCQPFGFSLLLVSDFSVVLTDMEMIKSLHRSFLWCLGAVVTVVSQHGTQFWKPHLLRNLGKFSW